MKNLQNLKAISGSFRDPSGKVFTQAKKIYRTVSFSYRSDYDYLMGSGLYSLLVKKKYLIPHQEVKMNFQKGKIYKIIQPEKIPFLSYPYEWSFSQLKDAALLTLEIQLLALEFGMSLKDASGFNLQFFQGKPIFIDTLSFERYKEGKPWVAYGQFCRHFLAVLALMAYRDLSLNRLLRVYLDGFPLDWASSLLPLSSYFPWPLFFHLHLHARFHPSGREKQESKEKAVFSLEAFRALIKSLQKAVSSLSPRKRKTEWGNYNVFQSYSSEAFAAKEKIFLRFLREVRPRKVWDFGANTGHFSFLAAKIAQEVISFDNDPLAVEKFYLQIKEKGETRILPLFLDLTNPSPALGWNLSERFSLFQRELPELVAVLALIHHLRIKENLPWENLADFFARFASWLIIEFVPKNDPQVCSLLTFRQDIFSDYDAFSFEKIFSRRFFLYRKEKIKDSYRVMYLFQRKTKN